uniref:Uncharacterized protein n=1 Tax=uncultured Acidobacteria bacterium HF4000_26D02 TaxID=710731 RepID=E0XW70_9BACT|nr:hypothetical protein [uncultured Acidobacteria bacterium HF4000_26D02]
MVPRLDDMRSVYRSGIGVRGLGAEWRRRLISEPARHLVPQKDV